MHTLRTNAAGAAFEEYGRVTEAGVDYPLLRLQTPGTRRLLITAGFHGEEPAGPLTLAEHFVELLAYANARDVGLTVYPCINPSGFVGGHRYNASGEKPNNDFLRYETQAGVWKGELMPDDTFLRYQLYDGGPQETRAVRDRLQRDATPHAALDLHQDNFMHGACTYAYVFGDRAAYLPLMNEAVRFAKRAIRCAVDDVYRTDDCGLVYFHDGSVTDYLWRRGVPYVATLETTTQTPMPQAHQVNLVWLRGFVELAARR